VRIGFDITALYIAQGGIFYYDYNLAKALLGHGAQHGISLLEYLPIRGDIPASTEVRALQASGAVVSCRGLRHRQLARWEPMRQSGLRPLAEWIDRAIFWPWASVAEGVMARQLGRALPDLDVFHSSEVVLWRHPRALNAVTIYDLTALLFPKFHTSDTIALQRRKMRFAQESADVVIAISEATKRDVVAHLGIPEERVSVVQGGVDPFFRPLDNRDAMARDLASLDLRPDGYVLHVGTLEPRKNLVRLIEAYGQVRRMLGPAAPKLALVGARGWQYQDVFARVEALGLGDAVRFLGQVPADALLALYNGAALLVYPSLYEGFGLPPLEAMACGTPVVASDTSSLPQVVGDAGLLVDPYDVGAIAETIVGLLEDDGLRDELSTRGLHCAARFTWMRSAEDLLSAYSLGIISH
jgi:glycosyltransferase involved in cell wall biosynthesis